MERQNIKDKLIKSCLNQKASIFLFALYSKKVKVDYPNKWRFYRFFNYMLKCSINESEGKLRLEITNNVSELKSNAKFYQFYDTIHTAPRLTLTVEEDLNHIHLDILPF